MNLAGSLNKMTVVEKLRTLEEIWNDLQGMPEKVPSPAWHADVLQAREKRTRAGKSRFRNWNEAKCRMRKRIA